MMDDLIPKTKMYSPITFNADWWVPEGHRRFSGERYRGTLIYYGDENSALEILHGSSEGLICRVYEQYDVLHGQSADGHLFTLFNVVLVKQQNFTKSTFNVSFILLDAHVDSLEEPVFNECVTFFPYLRDWAFIPRVSYEEKEGDLFEWRLDMGRRASLVSVDIEKGINTYLWGQLTYHIDRFSSSTEQATNYVIESEENSSVQQFLDLVSEFSEFLSIALFAHQYPSEIRFKRKGSEINYFLLFKRKPSNNPGPSSLIDYDNLGDRIPDMLLAWHSQHEQVAPIANYLIRSLRYDTPFDVPDFLIIAHALDGYFKRFVNKKDKKDTRKYQDEIDKLLKRFEDVEAIRKCKIDSVVLRDSRDKYSHLLPDDEEKKKRAVKGDELYWLTEKCKVLLTCCILEMLGLDIGEINKCCSGAPISLIVNSIPPWMTND